MAITIPAGFGNSKAVNQTTTDLDGLTQALTSSRLTPWDYGTAIIILVAAVIIGRLIRIVVKRVVARSPADNFLGDLIGRIANYVIVTFGLIYGLETLGIAIGPILGALGIVGIALAFAFQDILENFVAGVILQLQRPFTSGDEITTADHEGTITAVDTRTITIRTPDGEVVRIPSAEVIKNPIVNHTQNGGRRTTVGVGVAYGTDLDRAAEVARDAVAAVELVRSTPPPDVIVHTFGASSIDLGLRYWHGPSIAEEWAAKDAVVRSVAAAFESNGINIPFPQRVLHIPQPVEHFNYVEASESD